MGKLKVQRTLMCETHISTYFDGKLHGRKQMETSITKEEFYELIRAVEKADAWCPNGKNQGLETKNLLQKYKSRGGRVPAKESSRFEPYVNAQQTVRQNYKKFSSAFETLLPSFLTFRSRANVLAFVRLILKYERQVVPSLHMIFHVTEITWQTLNSLYKNWKKAMVVNAHFPSFLLNAWQVFDSTASSFTTFKVLKNKVEAKGQQYVGKDFWKITREETGVDFENAFDPCPWGCVFKDALSYEWPNGRVFLNPPFHLWEKFYYHAKKQFLDGGVDEMLLVMPFDRYHGFRNRDPCKWVLDLKKHEHTVFDVRYQYFLPDGSRHKNTFHTIVVHLF